MNTITITAMERPALFKDLIFSLLSNDLSGWRIFIALEPSDCTQEFFDICANSLSADQYSITVNHERLGIRLNPFNAINTAYSFGSEFNLYLEEDLVISPDATELAMWFYRNHSPDWLALNLLCGPCGTAGYLSSPWYPQTLLETKLFNSLGFAMKRDQWKEHLEKIWMGSESTPHIRPSQWSAAWGWDWTVYAYVAKSSDLKVVTPAFSRVNHLGSTGHHVTPDRNEQVFGGLEINTIKRLRYDLPDYADLAHEVRSHVNALEELGIMRLQHEYLDVQLARMQES